MTKWNGDARYWIFAEIRYADIFQTILADINTDTDIFPFCLETTPSLSCAEIISKIFINFGFNKNLFVRIK